MKYYLLIAGDNYYPQYSTMDWVGCFETREEAEAQVTSETKYETITRGKDKGKKNSVGTVYSIKGKDYKYDWYEIVDLMDWIK